MARELLTGLGSQLRWSEQLGAGAVRNGQQLSTGISSRTSLGFLTARQPQASTELSTRKPGPQETEEGTGQLLSPEPRHWLPVTPTISVGQSSPRGHKSTPLHGSAVKESVAASSPPQRATEKEQAWEDRDWTIEEMQRKVPRGQEVQTEAPEGDLLDGPAHREGRNGRYVAALATPLFCSCLVAQPYPALCDPIDCSSPDSFVSGRLQARILGWVAISFSRGSSCPRDGACISCKSPALQAGSSPLSHQGALDQTERTIALLSRSAQAREWQFYTKLSKWIKVEIVIPRDHQKLSKKGNEICYAVWHGRE